MFATDQKIISDFARKNADNTYKVLSFVQITIRQMFHNVPKMLAELEKTGDCKRLTNRQKNAIKVYQEKKEQIFQIIFSGLSVDKKLLFVANLPGFGLPKAGFVLQLLIGEVGCLDTHNLRRFNIKASRFVQTKKFETNQKKANDYIDVCQKIGGGCEKLWDDWCELVSVKYPDTFHTAEVASRLHVQCILSHP